MAVYAIHIKDRVYDIDTDSGNGHEMLSSSSDRAIAPLPISTVWRSSAGIGGADHSIGKAGRVPVLALLPLPCGPKCCSYSMNSGITSRLISSSPTWMITYGAYNSARPLRALKSKTPIGFILDQWQKEPQKFYNAPTITSRDQTSKYSPPRLLPGEGDATRVHHIPEIGPRITSGQLNMNRYTELSCAPYPTSRSKTSPTSPLTFIRQSKGADKSRKCSRILCP